MVEILAALHKYVPTVTTTEKVLVDGKEDEIVCDEFSKVLLGTHICGINICIYIYFLLVILVAEYIVHCACCEYSLTNRWRPNDLCKGERKSENSE